MNNKAAKNMSTAEDPSSSRESLSTAHSKKKKKKEWKMYSTIQRSIRRTYEVYKKWTR